MIARDDWWQKILSDVSGVIQDAALSIDAVYDGNDDYRRVHFDGDQDDLGRELDGIISADGGDFRDMMTHIHPRLDLYPAGSLVFCPLDNCPGHAVEGLR